MMGSDSPKISSKIELVSDGTIRMALVGSSASGKTSLAKALMPSAVAVGAGSCDSLAQADVVLYVHDLQRPCLNGEELEELKAVVEVACAQDRKNLIVVGTHRDCLSGDYANEALKWLESVVRSAAGLDIQVFGVSGSLWVLAKLEFESGREIAAGCFRESSGVEPVLEWLEGVRWRLQRPSSEMANQIADKVASILFRKLGGDRMVAPHDSDSRENVP